MDWLCRYFCELDGLFGLLLMAGSGSAGILLLSAGSLGVVSGPVIQKIRVLDLIESELVEDEMDWISCFPQNGTCLESLIFDCVDSPINFEALERLVVNSPSLKKLRLNRHVTIVQLYRLMVRAPQLTHLGTGSFGPGEIVAQGEQEPDYVSAFAACKSLVCLSGFREINAHYLPAIVPVCANLTSLNLSYATISTEQLKSFIYHCHKLQTLWVLDSVCDEGLQAVAATCKDLHEPVQVSFGRD
ncbi:transport inhibitor response 1-like protein [Coffea arabica]|uniref:Transport inhibitor response 1-like protein n=1 Tax=Coffea arabica TaxID=13443 RepID=A0A6P6U838_COFAR